MIDVPCSRKSFLAFGLCTLATGLVGCAGEDPAPAPAGGGNSGSGGQAAGAGGASAGSSGGGSGGAGGGGTGGAGGGGTGGAGGGGTGGASGGGSGGTGGGGSGGTGGGGNGGSGGGGASCNADITALCLPSNGEPDGHTHVLIVSAADILAGVDVTLETEEDATNHTHEVTLTAADFTTLKAGGVVTKDTCGLGPHQFVISCGVAPAPMMPDCQ